MDSLDGEMQEIHEQLNNFDLNSSLEAIANVEELDKALISYIIQSSRLLFAEREETWIEFHTANAKNCEKYSDYTSEQIRDHFQRKLLPNIYNYELTPEEKQIFELLKLHPEYDRTPNGYMRMGAERRIGFERRPKVGEDFLLVQQPQELRDVVSKEPTGDIEMPASEEFDLTKPANSPTHTLLMRVPYERQGAGYNFQFSSENAALLSAVLSNDFELSGRVLLEPREIHRRLKAAKRDFEQNARLPENLLDAEKLIEKLKRLTKLREAVVNVVANRF
ncbi:uncharacterized protein [Eurosta solidaginis]|uniref:uncharacterized protein n=1 Tax=Eurosta solidaginis TaxID=178769 RepID=UPI003530D53B